MMITMDDSQIKTLEQIRSILESSPELEFKGTSQTERYGWIEEVLARFDYFRLGKKGKGLVKSYLERMSGISRAQVTRLVSRQFKVGTIKPVWGRCNRFTAKYTVLDHDLLVQTDNAHGRLSGPATKKIFQRQYAVYGDKRFERLSDISSAHIVVNFHSDNGGEFINGVVAKLLNKLLIEQTKSRSGRTNDNALVEGKNGSVIRKHMGHWHIEQKHAPLINRFYQEHFNPYLNFHRPCGFATVTVDEKGRRTKKYKTYQTPYERLKMIVEAEKELTYLREGATLKALDAIAAKQTDNEAAALMQAARDRIFKKFGAANE